MGGCHTELHRHAGVYIHGRNTTGITQDDHLQQLKKVIIAGWPNTKDELHANIRPYWPYRDELVVIDSIIHKGRCIVILYSLRQQVLEQLHTDTSVSCITLLVLLKVKFYVFECL